MAFNSFSFEISNSQSNSIEKQETSRGDDEIFKSE